MTKTELTLTTTAWLQEGLRLKDVIIPLAGPTLVQPYIKACDACRILPWHRVRSGRLTTEERGLINQRDELHHACTAPLVDALNSGRIIIVRPDVSISGFVRLLPPAAGWRLRIFDLEKSLIFDPNEWERPLFVLFMFADREQVVAVEKLDHRRQSPRPNKIWLISAVQKFAPDDYKHGCRKRYAQKLEARMAEEAKTNKNLKPLDWPSISARLTEYKLWPFR